MLIQFTNTILTILIHVSAIPQVLLYKHGTTLTEWEECSKCVELCRVQTCSKHILNSPLEILLRSWDVKELHLLLSGGGCQRDGDIWGITPVAHTCALGYHGVKETALHLRNTPVLWPLVCTCRSSPHLVWNVKTKCMYKTSPCLRLQETKLPRAIRTLCVVYSSTKNI